MYGIENVGQTWIVIVGDLSQLARKQRQYLLGLPQKYLYELGCELVVVWSGMRSGPYSGFLFGPRGGLFVFFGNILTSSYR